MTDTTAGHVWPTLHYDDAPAAIDFLTAALGLEVAARYDSEDDPTVVYHAQLNWPDGGCVELSSGRGLAQAPRPRGSGSVYLVTSDPDAVYARAQAAGATVVRELRDDDYAENARSFIVTDPEGNVWAVGSYAGV